MREFLTAGVVQSWDTSPLRQLSQDLSEASEIRPKDLRMGEEGPEEVAAL